RRPADGDGGGGVQVGHAVLVGEGGVAEGVAVASEGGHGGGGRLVAGRAAHVTDRDVAPAAPPVVEPGGGLVEPAGAEAAAEDGDERPGGRRAALHPEDRRPDGGPRDDGAGWRR